MGELDEMDDRQLAAAILSDMERLAAGVAAYFVAAHRFDREGKPEDLAGVIRLERLLFETVKEVLRVNDMVRPSHTAEWFRNLPGNGPGEER